jgi:hypothetical protein
MTKAELLDSNTQLLDLVSQILTEEGMTATDMFFWGIAVSVIGFLLVVGGISVKKTLKLEVGAMITSSKEGIDALIAIQELHVEELVDVKKQQVKAGIERSRMLDTLENHEGRIESVEKKI